MKPETLTAEELITRCATLAAENCKLRALLRRLLTLALTAGSVHISEHHLFVECEDALKEKQ